MGWFNNVASGLKSGFNFLKDGMNKVLSNKDGIRGIASAIDSFGIKGMPKFAGLADKGLNMVQRGSDLANNPAQLGRELGGLATSGANNLIQRGAQRAGLSDSNPLLRTLDSGANALGREVERGASRFFG